MIYVRNDIPSQVKDYKLPSNVEGVLVEINLRKVKFLLIGIYHSTNADHGTSDDMKKTSKNVVVVHRGTKDFKIRANIVEMIRAEGRQTASKIKSDVKHTLEVGAGLQPDWLVNWVGDGELKQVCA